MKRFLKPTGQLLTTAVFTSTALETLLPGQANLVSAVEPPPPPDASQQAESLPPIPAKAKTVAPPEALSSQEFASSAQLDSDEPSDSIVSPSSSASSQSDRSSTTAHAPTAEAESAEDERSNQPPIAWDEIAEVNITEAQEPQFSPTEFGIGGGPSDESRENFPSRSATGTGSLTDGDRTIPPSADVPGADALRINVIPPRPNRPIPTLAGRQDDPPADVLTATREWLDETLASLVQRDRTQRETQFRANLMETARNYLAAGQIREVRRVMGNSALTQAERDELEVAIAEVEDNRFFPFLSSDRAIAQPAANRSQPNREWLMSRMSAMAASMNRSCDDPLVSAQPQSSGSSASLNSSFASMNHRIDDSIDDSSDDSTDAELIDAERVDAELADAEREGKTIPLFPNAADQGAFLSGGELLAGVGQQPPSVMPRKQLTPFNPVKAQNQAEEEASNIAARMDDCTPTLGQNIGGLTFATLSGYQWLTDLARNSGAIAMVFPLPVPAPITSRFGWRTHPIYGNRRFHFGVDFGAPMGTPVLAALPGRVETSSYLDGYGLTVVLENQDLEQRNLYAHLSGIAVQQGTWVEQGTVIGWVGSTGNSTGPHLHFEVHHLTPNGWVATDPLQAAAQLMANRTRRSE